MKTIITTIAFSLASLLANAQLNGSGKTITKTYDFKNFDKIYFENLDGKLEVEIGKPFCISVTIDDNLIDIFSITEKSTEHELTLSFKDNWNNKKYIENTNCKIKITMPEASMIKNIGNSNLVITNVIGRYFRIENTGNGDTKISGSTDSFDVVKSGNGNVTAEKLIAKKADIKNTGNGDVTVNVSEELTAQLNGNGDVKNIGKAKFDNNSKKTGNGDFINN
ncbi:GIN domain-containing protein [Flavobacterium sp.]|uniref:GIN domain-containing protein n=1 Tax=Flavobacterium sp. TaxID=239 RepID=UPI00391B06EB